VELFEFWVGRWIIRMGAMRAAGGLAVGLEQPPGRHIARYASEFLEQPDAVSGDIGGTQAGSGVAIDALHGPCKNIGRDLQPEIARGTAIAGEDAGDAKPALGEDFDMVAQPEDDAFKPRAQKVGQPGIQ